MQPGKLPLDVNVLKHLIQSESPLTIKSVAELVNSNYYATRRALIKLCENGLVLTYRKGKEFLYEFNNDSEKSDAAKKYIELSSRVKELDSIIGDKIILGWSKANRKPIEDWFNSFATNPKSMANAREQAMMIPLIMCELYEIAIDTKDKEWKKDEKLEELLKTLDKVLKTYSNLMTFLNQLRQCGWLWDGRHVEKHLIIKSKVDREHIAALCKKIREQYDEGTNLN